MFLTSFFTYRFQSLSAVTAQDHYYQRSGLSLFGVYFISLSFTVYFRLTTGCRRLSLVAFFVWLSRKKQNKQKEKIDFLSLPALYLKHSHHSNTYMIHVDRNAEFKMGLPAENSSLPRGKHLLISVNIPNNELAFYFLCVNTVHDIEYCQKQIFFMDLALPSLLP